MVGRTSYSANENDPFGVASCGTKCKNNVSEKSIALGIEDSAEAERSGGNEKKKRDTEGEKKGGQAGAAQCILFFLVSFANACTVEEGETTHDTGNNAALCSANGTEVCAGLPPAGERRVTTVEQNHNQNLLLVQDNNTTFVHIIS